MTPSNMYHLGNRVLQDHFDSRRIADRLEQARMHTEFNATDREIIEQAPFFFLATSNDKAQPDCSYKGGRPGFVRLVGSNVLAFPDYDGNGMFKSIGNIMVNPGVGLLFLEFNGQQRRLRINGLASLQFDDPLVDEFPGAQLIVRVRAGQIFPNCPRYIHRMEIVEHSVFAPKEQYTPPQPLWKSKIDLKDYLPKRKPKSSLPPLASEG